MKYLHEPAINTSKPYRGFVSLVSVIRLRWGSWVTFGSLFCLQCYGEGGTWRENQKQEVESTWCGLEWQKHFLLCQKTFSPQGSCYVRKGENKVLRNKVISARDPWLFSVLHRLMFHYQERPFMGAIIKFSLWKGRPLAVLLVRAGCWSSGHLVNPEMLPVLSSWL